MALKIVVKRRYIKNIQKITSYVNRHFGKKVADEFVLIVENKLLTLSNKPSIGVQTGLKNVRSVLVGKGFQNKIYYAVKGDQLIIINIRDTRRNPKKNPFNKIK